MGRPHRPILSRDLIVTTALGLMDRNGRFTVPELAHQLGVSVSSLYHHVSGRDDIVEGIRGHLASQIRLGSTTDWRDAVVAWARGYREAFAAHPAAIPLLVAQTISHPETLALYDQLADIVHSGTGLDGEDLLIAITMIDNLCLGAALDVSAPADVWAASPGRDTVLTRAVANSDPVVRSRRAFEKQLRLIVDDLAGQVQPA